MASLKLLPTDFSKRNQVKVPISSLKELTKRKLERFPYRYRLARAFENIQADNAISVRTLIGYEAGMKVFLAYTCYEQIAYVGVNIGVAGIKDKAFNEILNHQICSKFQKNKKFMNLIKEAYENGLANEVGKDKKSSTQLTKSLDKFIADTSADILCIAYAIRNMYAHGEFTGGGAGISNNSTKDLCYELADEVLDYANEIYSQCIIKLARRC
jgi:hypothetical protein